MPEGPSICILREEAAAFARRIIRRAEGNARIDMQRLPGQRVRALRSFGKQFLIELPDQLAVRIRLVMFGSHRIDERKDSPPRLSRGFDDGGLNFCRCPVRLLEGDLDELYDWCTDVMSDSWGPALVRAKWRTSRELQDHLAVSNVRDKAIGSNMAMDDSSFAHSNPASPSPTSPGMAATQLPAQAGILGSH